MNSKEEKLIQLARERFFTLSENDLKLFYAAVNGVAADYRIKQEKKLDDLVESSSNNFLQSERIAWLCTSAEVRSLITHLGLKIIGAQIKGDFDLRFALVDFPLTFSKCIFDESLTLNNATLNFLDLSGSSVKSVSAEGVKIRQSLLAQDGFIASGEMNLFMAEIEGNLNLNSANLINLNGETLIASGAEIKGSILLSENFSSFGKIRLYASKIGGNLECIGSKLSNPDNYTLDFDGAHIAGSIKLSNGFRSEGQVRLVGAKIDGNFTCDGGDFEAPTGFAILADDINIGGSVLLRNNFNARGEVRFPSALIGSTLNCNGGKFYNLDGDSLLMDEAVIKGSVSLGNGFHAKGSIRLFDSVINGSLICEGGVFISSDDESINANNINISGDVILSNGFCSNGTLNFNAARIKGSFCCHSSSLLNPHKKALVLDNARIENSINLCDGLQVIGATHLINTVVAGNINFSGGIFSNLPNNPEGYTLCLQGVDVKGSIYLQDDCQITGLVDLADSKIGNTLLMTGIKNSQCMILNLQSARTHLLADVSESWPKKGHLNIDGFTYTSVSRESPLDASARLTWIRLQYQEWKSDSSFLFTPQPYEQIAKVLKNTGHEKAAIKILIGKEKDRNKFEDFNPLERVWRFLLEYIVAFGYQPSNALICTSIFIIFGAIFFSYGQSLELMSPSLARPYVESSSLSSKISEEYQTLNPLLYSLDISFPIIDLQQQKYWLPNSNKGAEIPFANIKRGSLLRYWYWLQSIMGWFLSSLWVLAFTGIVRR